MSDVDTILKRLVADIDDAMEMQGTRWSSNERVAGLVQEALEQATRLIQVLYASEMSNLDQEIVSLKAKQPPVESLDSILEIEQDFYKWLDWNAHDMGEMGRFIRVKYAKNWWSEKGRQQLTSLIQTSNREAVEEYKKTQSTYTKYHKDYYEHKRKNKAQTLTKDKDEKENTL